MYANQATGTGIFGQESGEDIIVVSVSSSKYKDI